MGLFSNMYAQQQRRSRSISIAVGLALVLLVLPGCLDWSPRTLEIDDESNVVSKESSSDATSPECLALQQQGVVNAAASAELKVQKGSGSYQLALPNGVATTDANKGQLSWSQFGQDLWVDTYFAHKQGGTFVELGGYDGESHSNTLFFEKERNWQGILIEANPYSYEIMQTKDRSCWMAHACVTSHNHNHLTFQLAGGITSALEVASQQHTQRIQADIPKYGNSANWKGAGEKWCIPCFEFNVILHQTSVWKIKNEPIVIDYFSLDVEGAEMQILQALLSETEPAPVIKVFTIEMQENTGAIRSYLKSKGYKEVATVGIDSVFVLQTTDE